MGLQFKNPIGLAAGLDKNGDYIDALAALGFGFIEIGTLTPKPQSGNDKPRLFRLIKEKAIINRMGFNNKGIYYAKKKLAQLNYQGVLGINLGKNKDTPNENAADDYLQGMRELWQYASYFTINISSPNTQGLRELQEKKHLQHLLQQLKNEQQKIFAIQKKYVPLVVKISPDLSDAAILELAQVLLEEKIDGVIATNTTLARDKIANTKLAEQAGGLSGAPLSERNTAIIKVLANFLKGRIPIIASGGVMEAVVMRACDITFAFRLILIGVCIVIILGPSIYSVGIAVGIGVLPMFARLARAEVLEEMERDYVKASRGMGGTDLFIVLRHIIPNIAATMVVQLASAVSGAVLIASALDFLGMGTQPPLPSWGNMLQASRLYLSQSPTYALAPGIALTVFVIGINVFAAALTNALDPRIRTEILMERGK